MSLIKNLRISVHFEYGKKEMSEPCEICNELNKVLFKVHVPDPNNYIIQHVTFAEDNLDEIYQNLVECHYCDACLSCKNILKIRFKLQNALFSQGGTGCSLVQIIHESEQGKYSSEYFYHSFIVIKK